MRLVKATLKSRRTEDGTDYVFESVPVGKEYRVDLDSERQGLWMHACGSGTKSIARLTIDIYDAQGKPEGKMPSELLVIERSDARRSGRGVIQTAVDALLAELPGIEAGSPMYLMLRAAFVAGCALGSLQPGEVLIEVIAEGHALKQKSGTNPGGHDA